MRDGARRLLTWYRRGLGSLLAVLAVLVACGGAPRQPSRDAPHLKLSDELATACRQASDAAHVQACLGQIARALESGARSGAFNGLMIAPDACWSADETRPAMKRLCEVVHTAVESSGRRVAIEICDDTLIVCRTDAGGDGTTYNVRIKLIEAHSLARGCTFSAVQWSAYGMARDRNGAVLLVSDDIAHRLAAAIRPYFTQL